MGQGSFVAVSVSFMNSTGFGPKACRLFHQSLQVLTMCNEELARVLPEVGGAWGRWWAGNEKCRMKSRPSKMPYDFEQRSQRLHVRTVVAG